MNPITEFVFEYKFILSMTAPIKQISPFPFSYFKFFFNILFLHFLLENRIQISFFSIQVKNSQLYFCSPKPHSFSFISQTLFIQGLRPPVKHADQCSISSNSLELNHTLFQGIFQYLSPKIVKTLLIQLLILPRYRKSLNSPS